MYIHIYCIGNIFNLWWWKLPLYFLGK